MEETIREKEALRCLKIVLDWRQELIFLFFLLLFFHKFKTDSVFFIEKYMLRENSQYRIVSVLQLKSQYKTHVSSPPTDLAWQSVNNVGRKTGCRISQFSPYKDRVHSS